MSLDNIDLREALAALSHEQWSGWMEYLFSNCPRVNMFGEFSIPRALEDKWRRQLRSLYRDLSEEEKDRDRKEADKIIELLRKHGLVQLCDCAPEDPCIKDPESIY